MADGIEVDNRCISDPQHIQRHGRVNMSYAYSISNALQALHELFCSLIHFTHALYCGLYTILDLNVLRWTRNKCNRNVAKNIRIVLC